MPLLLPTIEVFRRLSRKTGKTERAILKLSGFGSAEVLTWPLTLVSNAYAEQRCFGSLDVSFLRHFSGAASFGCQSR